MLRLRPETVGSKMKLRIEIMDEKEISEGAEEELVLRCRFPDERIMQLQRSLAAMIGAGGEICLHLGDEEFFVPYGEVLFFETDGAHTAAHTAKAMYYTELRLCELADILPYSFIRVSKSCIVNSAAVGSITRNVTGSSEVRFRGGGKKTYVSRKFYKDLIERIRETRLR